jgi:acetolactate synthase-1/3 small subunit
MPPRVDQPPERHTLSVLVDNEAGVLARIVALFSGRGYNIDSLTVAEIDQSERTSRITIKTTGTRMIIDQIRTQLERVVPVHRVIDLTEGPPYVERELALIKVVGQGDKRVEALRIADAFRARTIDTTLTSFVFELTGASDKIESFIQLMKPLGLVEACRTGVVAIQRGPEGM